MAISMWARDPIDTTHELDMPGMFCIKRDSGPFGRYRYSPYPQVLGPMCDQCWIEDGVVAPLSSPACPHGGPRQGEHRNTATTASHGERRPSDPDRCRQCTRRQCDTRECRCPCHPDNYSRSLFGGAR